MGETRDNDTYEEELLDYEEEEEKAPDSTAKVNGEAVKKWVFWRQIYNKKERIFCRSVAQFLVIFVFILFYCVVWVLFNLCVFIFFLFFFCIGAMLEYTVRDSEIFCWSQSFLGLLWTRVLSILLKAINTFSLVDIASNFSTRF